ncbi:MAG: formylglycine-generating enzyme family protein [Gallionellaceae bacterium]|nr:formylglycine-generating enzyme family protein [Gallionellaceae bacterium]
MKISQVKRVHLSTFGKAVSLVVLLSFSVTSVCAQGEFDQHRKKTWEEFEEFKNGKPISKQVEKPAEIKPAAVPAAVVLPAPVVPVVVAPPTPAPVVVAKPVAGNFRDCPECAEMVVIPEGSFEMGERGDVTFVAAFAMGKTEVTQAQWKALMNRNPSKHSECGGDCPVETVSWEEVQSFIEILNDKTGKQYRLPNKAEWEYACRAGGKHRYCGTADLYTSSWHQDNSSDITHRVASKKANAFGLYDMNGNVEEFTSEATNNAKTYFMVRGGAYYTEADKLRPYSRHEVHLNRKEPYMGFRLVRALP